MSRGTLARGKATERLPAARCRLIAIGCSRWDSPVSFAVRYTREDETGLLEGD